ncbi:MAG: DMT family transporter [Candidatus Zixiibacteriota bacterium]
MITFRAMSQAIPYFGEILALLTAMTWAVAVILFKKSGEKVHPIALNLFKNFLAVILFIPTMWLFGETLFRNVPARDYYLLLLSGALGIGLSDTLFFKSLNYLGAGMHAIVNCLYSPSIIGLSVIWLGESMTALQIIGAAMIVSAVLTATSKKGKGNLSRHNLFWGVLLGVIATAASAVGIVMIKTLLERSPLLWATELRLFGGIAVLLIVLVFHSDRRRLLGSLMAANSKGYTISSSIMGAYFSMVLWLAGMKYTQASIASALNQTSNIFVFIFAALLLREPINLQRIIGISLGVIGALLVTFG